MDSYIGSLVDGIENTIFNSLGIRFREYQRYVFRELLEAVYRDGSNVVFVSMPTGSGKTLIEVGVGVWALDKGYRVLVLEPTRFLCDQMFRRFWSKILKDSATKEYEGSCEGFHDKSKRVVVSTPQTALKCVSLSDFDVVVVDEVHHMFGNKIYIDLLNRLRPSTIFGFTALLPSRKRAMWSDTIKHLGEPLFLDYDFKKLSELGGFNPPKAVVDIYDAEFNQLEDDVYRMLWIGRGIGVDDRILAMLRTTLVKQGKVAFCESLDRLVGREFADTSKEFEALCQSQELSHKARTILEVLGVFDIDSLKPVIVFTSRKATAYEIARGISEVLKIPSSRIAVLTGDVGRDEREKIVEGVKRGDVDVVVSTRVGEEGIDIPEAGLLIMCDIPRSELRFYQRLGRLIRLSGSPMPRLKYLVLILTPRTEEYYSLGEVLTNLYAEGVDVSYILVNMAEKGVEKRVVEEIERLASIYDSVAVPLTLITWSQRDLDPLGLLGKLASENNIYRDTLVEVYRAVYNETPKSFDDIYNIIPMISTISAIKYILPQNLRKRFDELKSKLTKIVEGGRFAKDLSRAIELGEVLYIYSVDKTSSLIAKLYQRFYRRCLEHNVCYIDSAIRFDYKWVTRLLMELFPASCIGIVIEKLAETVDLRSRKLKEVLRFDLGVETTENEKNKSVVAKLSISLQEPRVHYFIFRILFNYYDMYTAYIGNTQQIKTLVELNLKLIGLSILEKFIEVELETQNII